MIQYFYDQMKQFLDSVRDETREQGLLPLLEPVAPFNRSQLLLPLVVAGSLVSLIFLAGVAMGAFATLLIALLGLYVLLTEVFGISIELHTLR